MSDNRVSAVPPNQNETSVNAKQPNQGKKETSWGGVVVLVMLVLFSLTMYISLVLKMETRRQAVDQDGAKDDIDIALSSLVYPPSPVDLGAGYPGEELEGQIMLRNQGDQPVRIEKIIIGCGCLSADIDSSEIAPGENGTIRIKIKLPLQVATKRQRIRMISNDPVCNMKDLDILVRVKRPWIVCEPMEVDFGEIVKGKQYSQILTIADYEVNANWKSNEIRVRPQKDLFAVQKIYLMENGKQKMGLKVTLKTDKMPIGFFSDNLVIAHNQEEMSISVHGIVSENCKVAPNVLYLEEGKR